jgi:hypothetical protein
MKSKKTVRLACYFCKKKTQRKVRFGACTFEVPCCKKCERR